MAVDLDSGRVVIGKISGVYGIRGWVKIHSYTEPVGNFAEYSGWSVRRGGQWQVVSFAEIKPHGKGLVARIEGVSDRDTAALYTRLDVAVPEEQLPALGDDEFYWHQLEGLKVLTGDATSSGADILLGRVDHLIATGANDVLVVLPFEGSIDHRERLIPYLPDQVVLEVDLGAGAITVDWDPDF